jgi:hypothetical protein
MNKKIMNKKIRKLWEHVLIEENYATDEEYYETFAKLIINKCANIAIDADADHGDAILEYFDLPYIEE